MKPTSTISAVVQEPIGQTDRSLISSLWQQLLSHRMMLATVGSSFVQFFMFAVQGVLIARLLGPEGRGEYTTAIYYTQLLIYIGLVGTPLSIARRAANNKRQLPNLRRSVLQMSWLTSLTIMAAVMLLACFALPATKSHLAPLCVLCSLMLPWEHMRLSLLAVDHGSNNYLQYNYNLLIGSCAFSVLLVLLYVFGWASVTTVATLTIIAPMVALVLRYLLLPRGSIGKQAEPSPVTLIKEGRPFAVASISSDLFNQLDRFLILWLASFTIQGYYATAVSAANLMTVGSNALALFAFNSGANSRRILKFTSLCTRGFGLCIVQGLIAVVFAVVVEQLIVIVFGEAFRDAGRYARVLIFAYAIHGCSQVAEGYLRGRNRALIEVYSRMLGALMLLGTVYLTYETWGAMSIPYAAILSQLTATVLIVAMVIIDVRQREHHANKLADQPAEEIETGNPTSR